MSVTMVIEAMKVTLVSVDGSILTGFWRFDSIHCRQLHPYLTPPVQLMLHKPSSMRPATYCVSFTSVPMGKMT